jgi:hypothetical protein
LLTIGVNYIVILLLLWGEGDKGAYAFKKIIVADNLER